MRRRALPLLLAALLGLALRPAGADELLMVRVRSTFPETMNTLQDVIRRHGYTVSRVQRVDVGLTKTGYKTAQYRVVFFGQPEDIETLPARYPHLAPYLPLKITIFAERSDTLLVAMNPVKLEQFFPQPSLRKKFERWARDTQAILDEVQAEEEGRRPGG